MNWQLPTDDFLFVALWLGSAAVASIALLALQILLLRRRQRRKAAIRAEVVRIWRPVLTQWLSGDFAAPPPLARAHQFEFLRLWLYFQGSLRGAARGDLARLGREVGCEALAMALLKRRGRADQLVAILTLGHLGSQQALQALRECMHVKDRLLAMHATAAAVQIDPRYAAVELMPDLIGGDTWPPREVISVLAPARAECEPVLHALLASLPAEQLPRLLQVAEGLRATLSSAELVPLLGSPHPDIRVAALRLTGDPVLGEAVRALSADPDWRVRMQAAKALGRVGGRRDVERLAAMLGDREWWVRYRAAQTLAALPFMTPGDLGKLAGQAEDRYAADMLRQVMAEAGMADTAGIGPVVAGEGATVQTDSGGGAMPELALDPAAKAGSVGGGSDGALAAKAGSQ